MASRFGLQSGGSFVKVTGDRETIRKLNALAEKGFPTARSAAGLSMTPVKKAIQNAAPESEDPGHGALKESITKKTKGYRKDGGIFSAVGVDKAFARISAKGSLKTGQKVPSKYLHFVELTGTKRHKQPNHPRFKHPPYHPGSSPKHFMQRTFEKMRQSTTNLFSQKFAEKYNKEIRKQVAK